MQYIIIGRDLTEVSAQVESLTTSASFLAELSVSSPQEIFIFII